MIRVLRYAATVLLLATVVTHAEPSEDAARAERPKATGSGSVHSTASTCSQSTNTSTRSGNATCISRTANYITHTLPQQCLRTDRVATNASQATGSDSAGTSLELDTPSTNSSVRDTAEPTPENTYSSTAADTASDGTISASSSYACLLYTSPSPRDGLLSRMPSSA